jgi:hypothetical protein
MLHPRRGLAICLALLVTTGSCSSVSTQMRPHQAALPPPTEGPLSLFPSDAAALGDAEIGRILDVRVALPAQVRIGVLHLEHRSADYGWLYAGERTPATWLFTGMFEVLRKAERAYDASYLPTMLIPQKLTVGYLREAAARYQADLLLVFRTECRTYQQYNVFKASEAKAYCLADAAVLDVRSGLVPFTSRATQDFLIKEAREDVELGETVRRSEQLAAEAAMAEIATNVVAFLRALPPQQKAAR